MWMISVHSRAYNYSFCRERLLLVIEVHTSLCYENEPSPKFNTVTPFLFWLLHKDAHAQPCHIRTVAKGWRCTQSTRRFPKFMVDILFSNFIILPSNKLPKATVPWISLFIEKTWDYENDDLTITFDDSCRVPSSLVDRMIAISSPCCWR